MEALLVPPPVREKLGDAGSDGLVMMFAEAHRIAIDAMDQRLDRRLLEMDARIERRLSDLKFELVKWNFVFWIGQLAAMTAILNLMLRGLR
jgi:hypothetical protein